MKITLIIVFLLLTTVPLYSQEKGWSIGMDYNPFFYWNYNKKDWNNMPYSYPAELYSFNGSKVGIRVIRYYKEFGIQSGIYYSSQVQKHITTFTSPLVENENINKELYNDVYTRHFNYLHIPILITKTFELGYESNLFVNLNAGANISFLSNYKATLINFDLRDDNNTLLLNPVVTYKNVQKNGSDQTWIKTGNDWNHYESKTPYLFNKILFGFISSVSLSKEIFNRYEIEVGVTCDYGLVNTEKSEYRIWYPQQLTGGWTENEAGNSIIEQRSETRNIRLGPFLAMKYKFGK